MTEVSAGTIKANIILDPKLTPAQKQVALQVAKKYIGEMNSKGESYSKSHTREFEGKIKSELQRRIDIDISVKIKCCWSISISITISWDK